MAKGQSLYDWCMENGDWGQQLLFEFGDGNNSQMFLDEETGIHKCPMDFTYGSGKKIPWKCKEGHKWIASVMNRVINKSECKECCNSKRSITAMMSRVNKGENDLQTWCKNNGEWGQQIIEEFSGTDELGKTYKIDELCFCSTVKMLWICKGCNNKWSARIYKRTASFTGCPKCGHKKQSEATAKSRLHIGENDLQTWCENNGEHGQQIINEWTGLDEDGNTINMNEVTYGSTKKLMWRCFEEHEWFARIKSRTYGENNCPNCREASIGERIREAKIIVGKNDLLTWCKNNDKWGQQLINEWEGLDEDGNKVNITDVTYGTTRKMLWKCKEGHKWYISPYERTKRKAKCPNCSIAGTSYTEQLIYQALKILYPDCKNRVKCFFDIDSRGLEYDIVIPSKNIYIEYSPQCTHKYKMDKDKIKAIACMNNGVRFIYVSDKYIYDTLTREYTDIKDNNIHMLTKILEILNRNISELDMNNVQSLAYKFSYEEVEEDKQLQTIYPELAKEWHSDNTADITRITFGSSYKVKWHCTKCGYGADGEWISKIATRTAKGKETGCPNCGYNWSGRKLKRDTSDAKIGFNDLKTTHPELVKEWHSINEVKSTEVRENSGKVVKWQCTQCDYGKNGEWQISIYNRAIRKSGCPNCGYNWYKAQTGQPQKLKTPKKKKSRGITLSLEEFI